MRPLLYFHQYTINLFIQRNNRISRLYEDTKVDKDKLWKKYEDEAKQSLQEYKYNPNVDGGDLADIYTEKISDMADIFWQIVPQQLFQSITVLYQNFENEIVVFINEEANRYLKKEAHDSIEYGEIEKKLLKLHKIYPLQGINKIHELKLLTNVIKHGHGKSYKQLKKVRPDYFEHNDFVFSNERDTIKTWKSVYNNYRALNVQEKEFYIYLESINKFWESLPERVYIDGEEPLFSN